MIPICECETIKPGAELIRADKTRRTCVFGEVGEVGEVGMDEKERRKGK